MGTPVRVPSGAGKEWPTCPAGQQRLICADVIRRGPMETPWGMIPKVDLIFLSEKIQSDGKPFDLLQRFTDSLNVKANLRKFLEQFRGHDILPSEAKPGEIFDLDKVIGLTGYANIIHVAKPKRVYANIKTIMPLPPGMQPLEIPDWYERHVPKDAQQMMEQAWPEEFE